MLLYQHVLQDLRLAGLTDIIADLPCDFTQRQEHNPFRPKLPGRGQAVTQAAAVTGKVARATLQQDARAQTGAVRLAAPAPAPRADLSAADVAQMTRTQMQPGARAWVILADNSLDEGFARTPVGDLLGKMLRAIQLDDAQVNLLRFAEQSRGRRLSAADMLQLGAHVAQQVKTANFPLLIFGQMALQVVLGHDKPMAAVQGQVLPLPLGQPGVATYHPSLVLEKPDLRRRVWDALRQFEQLLATGA